MWESSEAKRLKMARGKEEGNVLDIKLFCQYFRKKKTLFIDKLLRSFCRNSCVASKVAPRQSELIVREAI